MTNFPVLDVARAEYGRHVVNELGTLEPRITEWQCRMPVRLVEHDIETLRAAVAAYDDAAQPSAEVSSGSS